MKSSNTTSNNLSKIVEFYDNINILYESIYPNYKEHNKILAKSLASKVNFENIQTFVDLGCGTSNLLFELAQKYPEVNFFGIDISSKTIDYCMSEYNLPNIVYINSEWNEGLKSIEDEIIDVIVCLGNTISHLEIPKQQTFADNIINQLSSNGIFIYDSYKDWNDRINSEVDYYFEPKGLSRDKDNLIVNSDFFSRYKKNIAIRNIFITTYEGFNQAPKDSKHFITWQFPLDENLTKNKIDLIDGIGLFTYYLKNN
jgi:SAM-dependent methyltransferase